jgi:phosphoribosylaminoimidazolecarboxamide formyltransferase/IMP cyclohydrolase
LDLTASIELISDIDDTACCIIKHTNPCGAAIGKDVCESYEKALSCDPVSAFGGIVVFNKEVDEKTASKLNDIFLEIVCAPKYSEKALELLSSKKNRRLIKIKSYQDKNGLLVKSVLGGILAQTKDSSNFDENTLSLVTKKEYTETELEDLKFAWIVCKHTKSNAIVLAKNRKIIGVGAGQMSRVDSVKIAITKAKQFGHDLKNAVAASDAFFPFADGVLELAEQGITSIVQPGGSIRDEEVINAANEKNISMIFTGIRNFKH